MLTFITPFDVCVKFPWIVRVVFDDNVRLVDKEIFPEEGTKFHVHCPPEKIQETFTCEMSNKGGLEEQN